MIRRQFSFWILSTAICLINLGSRIASHDWCLAAHVGYIIFLHAVILWLMYVLRKDGVR